MAARLPLYRNISKFPLRLYLVPKLYHGSRRECLVASEAQSERWVFSGSFLEQRVGPIRLEMSETFPVHLPSSSSGGTGCRQAFLLHWWWEGVEPGLAESKIRCKWTPYQRSNFLFLAPGPQKLHGDARVTFSVEELSHGWLHIKII